MGIALGVAALLACVAFLSWRWRTWLVPRKAAPSDYGWPKKPGLADSTDSEEAAGAQAQRSLWVMWV